MNKEEILALLRIGNIKGFNKYRVDHPEWIPDLSGEDISKFKLFDHVDYKSCIDLHGAILFSTVLPLSRGGYYYISSTGSSFDFRPNFLGALIDSKTLFDGYDLVKAGAILVSNDEATQITSRAPKVFISYAWANDTVVLAIDYWLRLKNIKTMIDKRDFFAGSRIRDEITRVMKKCDVILIFHSQLSKDKPWTEFERELASDIEMEAKKEGKLPPRIIYIVIDDAPLPSISEKNRIAIMAKGKRFELVCEEIYYNILQIPAKTKQVDLEKFRDFVF